MTLNTYFESLIYEVILDRLTIVKQKRTSIYRSSIVGRSFRPATTAAAAGRGDGGDVDDVLVRRVTFDVSSDVSRPRRRQQGRTQGCGCTGCSCGRRCRCPNCCIDCRHFFQSKMQSLSHTCIYDKSYTAIWQHYIIPKNI